MRRPKADHYSSAYRLAARPPFSLVCVETATQTARLKWWLLIYLVKKSRNI